MIPKIRAKLAGSK